MQKPTGKTQMHPRNPHRAEYDFPRLIQAVPALGAFVATGDHGRSTIDFSDPAAVKTLNQALLKVYYGIVWWDLKPGSLCPPVPGRADYIHHAADLLGGQREARVLDIGVGANCIYPIIGHWAYGWKFVGAELQANSLNAAKEIIERNPGLGQAIELRLQSRAEQVFAGIIQTGEYFDLSVCNPPFHASAREAADSNRLRLEKMGLAGNAKPGLNFGGSGAELWCPGGEGAFLKTMVAESRLFAGQVGWFTSLVSRRENLPDLYRQLKQAKAAEVRTVPMSQGQKSSRFVAWRFAPPPTGLS